MLSGQNVADGFDAIRKGGTVVVTAVPPAGATGIPIDLGMLPIYEKRIQGTLFGMMSPVAAVPHLLGLYEQGMLKLDELVSRTYTLDQINEGFDDMRSGRNIRGVITFD